jgi:hypothetical protein
MEEMKVREYGWWTSYTHTHTYIMIETFATIVREVVGSRGGEKEETI